jgi:hypothetical protein
MSRTFMAEKLTDMFFFESFVRGLARASAEWMRNSSKRDSFGSYSMRTGRDGN